MKALGIIIVLAVAVLTALQFNGIETGVEQLDHAIPLFLSTLGF